MCIRDSLNHEFCSALQQPGEADVTVDVDFAALRDAVNEIAESQPSENRAVFHGPVLQRDFLARMGIMPRFEALMQHASPEQSINLKKGLVRLMDTESGMGQLFKAAAITPVAHGSPAGFA